MSITDKLSKERVRKISMVCLKKLKIFFEDRPFNGKYRRFL